MAEQTEDKCGVLTGPCLAMLKVLVPQEKLAKGITAVFLTDVRRGEQKMPVIKYRLERSKKRDIALKFCPWCGEKILFYLDMAIAQ